METEDGVSSSLVTLKSFISRQLSSRVKVSFTRTLSMLRKGFYGESFVLYSFQKNDPRNYLSDYARFQTRFINIPYKILLRDKDVFQTVMGRYIDVPRNLGIIRHGEIYSRAADLSLDSLLDTIINSDGVIIKPLQGSGGYNVMRLRARGGDLFLNDKGIDRQELCRRLLNLDNYLICEFVQQGDYAQKIFPESTNTIRIVTMVDPKTGVPFIAATVHRFGTSKSIPTDNWTQGGLSAKIDVETGAMGKAVAYPAGASQLQWHSRHPETGAKIEGEVVPGWEGIKEKILQLARVFSVLKYVGWDVVATNTGVKQ